MADWVAPIADVLSPGEFWRDTATMSAWCKIEGLVNRCKITDEISVRCEYVCRRGLLWNRLTDDEVVVVLMIALLGETLIPLQVQSAGMSP
jgi:hypothetical protein